MKKKKNYIGLIIISAVTLIVSIKSVYAFYYEDSKKVDNIVNTQVADIYDSFETQINREDIDMRVRVYLKLSNGLYTGSNDIPKSSDAKKYALQESMVACKDGIDSSAKTVECKKGPTADGSCYYIYNETNGTITLENSGKALCSFYFDPVS